MRRTLLTATATAFACTLSLAACGGSEEVAGPPTPVASPSATPSASPSAAAKETPEEFIRRWLAEAAEATTTGDVTQFKEMADPACEACLEFIKGLRRIYAAGGHVSEEPIEILWIRYSKARMHGAETTYHVHERISPSRYRESPDGPWRTLPGGIETDAVYLVESPSGWLVREYAQLEGTYSSLPSGTK